MRRYDLDNLRVLLFLLLILYHVGMFFCPWNFHFKNNELVDWLTDPMLFLNQWRLPLLFVISGMGTAFAMRKRTALEYIKERHIRLLFPFLFGMLVVVPPQVYLERIVKLEYTGSYFSFLGSPAFQGAYPDGNISWHHLWFILYLLIFSVVFTPLFIYIRKHKDNQFMQFLRKAVAVSPAGIFILALPFLIPEYLLKPVFPSTHGLLNDYYNLVHYALFYLSGFLLIHLGEEIRKSVQTYRKSYLISGLITFVSLLSLFNVSSESSGYFFFAIKKIEPVIAVVNIWAWILVCLGYASSYLSKSTPLTFYANESVYPLYILHQTVQLIIGFFIYDLSWNVYLKIVLMVFGTFFFSLGIYEYFIRRVNLLRILFGLKRVRKQAQISLN